MTTALGSMTGKAAPPAADPFSRLLAHPGFLSVAGSAGIFAKDYVTGECAPNAFWRGLGFAAADMSGQRWKRFVHPGDRETVDAFERSILGGEIDSWSGEFRVRGADGKYRHVLHRALVLERAAGGTPSLYVGMDIDVTEYVERAEDARVASERHERRLRVSEEIRTAGAILSSELDPVRSAEHMLAQARRVVPFDAAAAWCVEDDELIRVADIALGDLAPARRSFCRENLPGKGPEKRMPGISVRNEGPFASRLELPMLVRGRVIGFLEFFAFDEGAYGPNETATAMLFAEHASVAFSNALKYRNAEREAATDWLTGLPTRRAFSARAARLQGEKPPETPLSAFMIDLDHFKKVNDSFGHAAGDVALTAAATACREALRAEDFCCRYGGEEIVVLLPGADARIALSVAERVRARVEALEFAGRPGLRLTVSIGVAHGTVAADYRDLVERADEALYLAKERGRNRCELS